MCPLGWYSRIGLVQSTISMAKILLLHLWQKDLCWQIPTYHTEFYTPAILLHCRNKNDEFCIYFVRFSCFPKKHENTYLVGAHGTFQSLVYGFQASSQDLKHLWGVLSSVEKCTVYPAPLLLCLEQEQGGGQARAKRGPDKLYAQTFPRQICFVY